jgi:predicted ester cyclase
MPTQYPTILHRWFEEVWNQKNSNAIHELFSDDTVIYGLTGPGGEPIKGRTAFEKFHADFVAVFPDVHIDVDDVVSEGEKIAGRFTVSGTQQGDLPEIAATGKKVLFTGSGVATVRDGKFVEVWNEVDFPKMQYDLAPDTPDVE